MSLTEDDLARIYLRRFAKTTNYRKRVWQVLSRGFFTQWIKPEVELLDLGCGYGEFSNSVCARKKWAMDLNPDSPQHLIGEVTFLHQDCATKWPFPAGALDVVFTSNFLEHLPDKEALKKTLREACRCLRTGGRFIAMGPNIKYLPGRYWDFIDHHVALTETSLSEALEMEGFSLEIVVPRFLPYTLINSPEYPLFMLKLYLSLPCFWRIFGKQFLLIARKA